MRHRCQYDGPLRQASGRDGQRGLLGSCQPKTRSQHAATWPRRVHDSDLSWWARTVWATGMKEPASAQGRHPLHGQAAAYSRTVGFTDRGCQ